MSQRPLRFVTFLAPNLLPLYRDVVGMLGEALRIPVELVVGRSYERVADEGTDAVFICGLPYVQLERRGVAIEPLAAPVLQGERYQGRPVYFSDVIVRCESPLHSFADLRGCRWAYNEPDSQSGYGIVRQKLLQMGETRGFFGEVVEAGWHQESIRMVHAGEVDASAIDSQVLAVEMRDHPELAGDLRVIEALGPSTIQPLVVARRLPGELKDEMRSFLLQMHRDSDARRALEFGLVARWVSVDRSSYDDIRQMLEAAEMAGFTTVE